MISQTFNLTTGDNVEIFTHKWLPDSEITLKGIVQIAHGMAEHSARYNHVAEFLTQNGYVVFANDHRGHGQTIKNENDMGFFANKDGWFKVVDDMFALTQFITKEYPALPLFIFGHSMGSFLTRTYICKHSKFAQGIILSGTGGNPGIIRYIAKLIVFMFKNFKGKRAKVKLLDSMSFGEFNKRIKNHKTPFDWLSTDENEVQKYINDPFCGKLFTVKFFDDLLTGLGYIFRKKNMRNISTNLPIMFISGSEDPVGNFGKGVTSSYNKYKKMGIKDVSMTLYPGMRHEIVNEIGKEKVFADILSWLNKHI